MIAMTILTLRERVDLIVELRNNKRKIEILAKTMYKDGLIAQMGYEEGLLATKVQERDKLLAMLAESIEKFRTGEYGFSFHHKIMMQAQRNYHDNILITQNEFDKYFIDELEEERQLWHRYNPQQDY
jgi:hypothetical protein